MKLLAFTFGVVLILAACEPSPKAGQLAIPSPTPSVTSTPDSRPYIESRPVVDPAAEIREKSLVVPPAPTPSPKL